MNNLKRIKKIFVIFVSMLLVSNMVIISSVYANDSVVSGYKNTSKLTSNDMYDSYQKNYQKAAASNKTSYLYKSAEWTDKDSGNARIKLTMKTDKEVKTTAVYAFTDCTAHHFSRDIAKSNINYLLEHYDQVDVIVANGSTPGNKGIKQYIDVKNTDFMSELTFAQSKHYNLLIYTGLYDYLMNATPGSETGNEEQQRFPTAIYTSFDSRITASTLSNNYEMNGNISPDYLKNLDIGSILKKYDSEGRYFSMCACGEGNTKYLGLYDSVSKQYVTSPGVKGCLITNILALLMDPQTWINMDTATKELWDGSSTVKILDKKDCKGAINFTTNRDYHVQNGGTPVQGDYLYTESFEEVNIPIVEGLNLTDTIDEAFEIKSATCSNPDAVVSTDGNKVDVKVYDYTPGEDIVVTIDIQLKDLDSAKYKNCWLKTNEGKARFKAYENGEIDVIMDVDSPKLARTDKKIVPQNKKNNIDSNKAIETGDTANIGLYIGLMIAALVGLSGVLIAIKRKAK